MSATSVCSNPALYAVNLLVQSDDTGHVLASVFKEATPRIIGGLKGSYSRIECDDSNAVVTIHDQFGFRFSFGHRHRKYEMVPSVAASQGDLPAAALFAENGNEMSYIPDVMS